MYTGFKRWEFPDFPICTLMKSFAKSKGHNLTDLPKPFATEYCVPQGMWPFLVALKNKHIQMKFIHNTCTVVGKHLRKEHYLHFFSI